MKIAVYPGTFDPVTSGHINIIQRAAKLFDRVIVAVAVDNYKNAVFTLDERIDLIRESCKEQGLDIEVDLFSGLLADYLKDQQATAIIRGLRVVSDFEYEMQMASFNKHLYSEVDTIFLAADTEFAFVSSSMIKNIAKLQGDVKKFVPMPVAKALKEKYDSEEK